MENVDTQREWLTVKQAAEQYQIGERTLRQLYADGELPAWRVKGGRSIRLKREEVEALFTQVEPKENN